MNPKIYRLQNALKLSGFDPGPLDGSNGPKTQAALAQWYVAISKKPKGIDISHYQPQVNWPQLAQHINFVILRSSASTAKDKLFQAHRKGAKEVKLPWGCYHFFTPWQDPSKQAELVMSILGEDRGDLPIVADVEALAPKQKKGQPAPKPVSTSELVDKAGAFLEALEILSGRVPVFYTYSAFNTQHKLGKVFGKKYPLWIADYRSGPPTVDPSWDQVIGHQYQGDLGRQEGVGEGKWPCDLNRLDISVEAFKALGLPCGSPS